MRDREKKTQNDRFEYLQSRTVVKFILFSYNEYCVRLSGELFVFFFALFSFFVGVGVVAILAEKCVMQLSRL